MTGTTDAAHRQPCAQTFLVVKPLLPVDYSRCGAKTSAGLAAHTPHECHTAFTGAGLVYLGKITKDGTCWRLASQDTPTWTQVCSLSPSWQGDPRCRYEGQVVDSQVITFGNRLAALKIKGCLAKGVSALRQTIMTSHTLSCCNGFNRQYGISCCLGYSTFLGPRKKTTRIETSILLFN